MENSTFTIRIYHDGDLKKEFTGQTSDTNAFGYLLKAQGNSVNHALKYEGWKVEQINEQTGKSEFWKPYV